MMHRVVATNRKTRVLLNYVQFCSASCDWKITADPVERELV